MIMMRRRNGMMLITVAALLLGHCLAAAAPITLYTRNRVEADKWIPPESHTKLPLPEPAGPYIIDYKTIIWEGKKTAIIVCDMWNTLKNKIPADRVAEMAPRMNEVLIAAREKGILIIHSPSGTMDFYMDTPQRARCQAAPPVETNVSLQWNYLNKELEDALPIDDSDNGWEGPLLPGPAPQTRQHPAIEIMPEDAIGDSKDVYYLLKQQGIENVILMGVHTNMCVLGRPFGIRQLTYLGMNVALMRDMTDSLYNPAMPPKVSHYRGTDLVLEHIEKFWCPTVTSTDFTGKPMFRFAGDTRTHVVFVVSDDHYQADKTLPDYAQWLRETQNIYATILHGQGEHDIPGTENIATADVVVVFVRRLGLPVAQVQAIQDYVNAGKPLIALRTASHGFKLKFKNPKGFKTPEGSAEWEAFDHEILGGNYHNHGPNDLGTDVKNVVADHPLLKGVTPAAWHSTGSLYFTKPIVEDATLLMTGSTPDDSQPLTWIRDAAPGRGKVFYSGLGHPDDFKEPAFRQLLVNAIQWAITD
jgi:nicotinamidase-related amidase/type 1 glutamine amidotransferase